MTPILRERQHSKRAQQKSTTCTQDSTKKGVQPCLPAPGQEHSGSPKRTAVWSIPRRQTIDQESRPSSSSSDPCLRLGSAPTKMAESHSTMPKYGEDLYHTTLIKKELHKKLYQTFARINGKSGAGMLKLASNTPFRKKEIYPRPCQYFPAPL